jgi:putative PIN family toxin of toxin-antitoxin system
MVYLQAAARPEGPARACLNLARAGRVELATSPSIQAEVADVLGRPKIRQKFKSLTSEAVAVFLEDVGKLATSTENVAATFSLPRDPKDEPYVNLALAVAAQYLVTWDKDLLTLMDESGSEGKAFREGFPGLTILDPVSFLRRFPLKESESAATE